MKKDVHFKIDEGLVLAIKRLSYDIQLPVARIIETAVREYIEMQKKSNDYRLTGVNNITGVRQSVSAKYKSKEAAQAILDDIRKHKTYIQDYYTRLQIEKVTI